MDIDRLTFAKKLGADRIVDVTKENLLEVVKSLTPDGRGVDVVLECSGSGRATATGIEAVRKQGQFVQIGLAGKPFELNFDRICYKEIKVTGSLGSVWTAWKNAIRLVETKQLNLKDLISHEFKLQDGRKALRSLKTKRDLRFFSDQNK